MAKLSDLKLLVTQAQLAKASASVVPSLAPKARGETIAASPRPSVDVDLGEVFADVQPLVSKNRAKLSRQRPSAIPVKSLADEADALAASKYGAVPSPSSWDIGQELEAEQTFLRPGLGSAILTKLRHGHWAVQAELDLHRLTSDEARDALADFLLDARWRGWRCVRVVHGKGLSSPNREPVLKGKVRRWLTRWDDVLAYCEAPRTAGGSGAVLVLLKAQAA